MSTAFKAKIKSLRKAVGMTQAQMASALGVAQSLVSSCESAPQVKPPAHMLVGLGNIAAQNQRYEDATWFWKEAGIKTEWMVPAALKLLKDLEMPIAQGEMTSVPPSADIKHAARGARRFRVESEVVPNALAAAYVAIPDDSLLPAFKRGDLLVLDKSESDLSNLSGACIAVNRVAGLTLAGSQVSRAANAGLRVGWLQSAGPALTLVAPAAQGGFSSEVVAVEAKDGFTLVQDLTLLGRVIAWYDMQGKQISREGARNKKEKSGK